MTGTRWLLTCAAAIGLGGTLGCEYEEITPLAKPVLSETLPECPHAWKADSSRILSSFAPQVSGVPELHDCQRLIVTDSTGNGLRFGDIAGVFANPRGEHFTDDSLRSPRPLALIFLPEGGSYAPLRIGAVFSCVWVFRSDAGYGAAIRTVTSANECISLTPGALARDDHLEVRTHGDHQKMSPRPPDVPNVARWDWDETSKTHFIGVRCGDAWCEIGRRGFGDSPNHVDAKTTIPVQYSRLAVKGNYDEQPLAEWQDGQLIVGKNRGTVFPDVGLERFASNAPREGSWTRVAHVNMHGGVGSYGDRMNLIGNPRPLIQGQQATISLCRGSAKTCRPTNPRERFAPAACTPTDGVRWYARIDRPDGPPKYFCVMYRKHPNDFSIPPVVRWRWRDDDETFWVRCPAGCCEVNVS